MQTFSIPTLPSFIPPPELEGHSVNRGIELGTAVHNGLPVVLTPNDLRHGTLIVGRTGVGKSKLAEWILRQLLVRRSGRPEEGATFVFDPHWSLACDVINFAAACRLKIPIMAIDPAGDPLIAYDPIRSNYHLSSSTIADQFASWMSHAWRRSDDDAAPLLESNLKLIVRTLLDTGVTLGQAPLLVDPDAPMQRRMGIVARLTDPTLKAKWNRLISLSTSAFISQMGSASRALSRIPDRASLMLGQPASFSFQQAIDEGWFVFIRTGGDEGIGTAMASIMLDDLWNTIRSRKAAPRPVHVIIDEFTQLCGPHTVEMLNGGRKFDLRLVLLMQSATQLKRLGESGRRAFDEIMLDCLNKVCMPVDTASAASMVDELGTNASRLAKLTRMHAMVHTLSMPPAVSVEVATRSILPVFETPESRQAYLHESLAEIAVPFAFPRKTAFANLNANLPTLEGLQKTDQVELSDEPDEFTRVIRKSD